MRDKDHRDWATRVKSEDEKREKGGGEGEKLTERMLLLEGTDRHNCTRFAEREGEEEDDREGGFAKRRIGISKEMQLTIFIVFTYIYIY